MSAPWVELIGAIVRGQPKLDGALCRGHAPEFDGPEPRDDPDDTAQRIAFAINVCRCCPALRMCGAWFGALPVSDRPAGIVAAAAPGGRALPTTKGTP